MVRRNLFPVAGTDLGNRTGRNVAARDPFTALQTEMNRLFDDLWQGLGAGAPAAGAGGALAAPQIDLQEDDENLYVVAELPGMSEDDVELTYNDGVLRIAGEKKAEHEDQDRQVHVTERAYGRFERQIPLHRAVNEEQISAAFKDGVLTVTLPKSEAEGQARRIEVQRAA